MNLYETFYRICQTVSSARPLQSETPPSDLLEACTQTSPAFRSRRDRLAWPSENQPHPLDTVDAGREGRLNTMTAIKTASLMFDPLSNTRAETTLSARPFSNP